jgi:hypothetical protein
LSSSASSLLLLKDVFAEPSDGGVRGADPAGDFGISIDDDALASEVPVNGG